MNRGLKTALRQILAFVIENYLVIFLTVTFLIKLYYFDNNISSVANWGEYSYGALCNLMLAPLIFMPLFFVRKHKNMAAIILATILSFIIVLDTVYYSYFSALPTIGMLGSVGQTKDIGPAILAQFNWYFLLYFLDVFIAIAAAVYAKPLIVRICKKYKIATTKLATNVIAVLIVLFGGFYALNRVGFNRLSEVIDRGFDTVSTSQYYGTIGAQIIDIARYFIQETTHLSARQQKELINWVNAHKPKPSSDPLTATAKGKNVIVLQVESLGGFVINQKINGKEITPNLDKLAKQTYFYPNERFMIGAGHTSDTDFVVNSSYFPISDASVFIRYGQDKFTGLPKAFTMSGYSAYAYHGFNRNFWNRNVAMKSLGYQKFYAADDYPKDWTINMGLNDGTFLSKTAELIVKQPKPSFSYVITLSSHVPFATNDKTAKLGLKLSDYPDQVGGYLEDINYTDRMIGQFFDKLKSEGLYDDSLILVYGDHTPVLPAFNAGSIKYDPSTKAEKEVPLMIKLPNQSDGKTVSNTGSHIDIMPTILDLVGIKTNQLMFGQSLFASGSNALKVCKDQLVSFKDGENCQNMLLDEQAVSAEIIRYNQFNNLPK